MQKYEKLERIGEGNDIIYFFNQWRIQEGGGATPPVGGLSIEVLVYLTSVMSLWTCHLSVTENGHIWQLLHQYCDNGLQMENKLQEMHHLGTQKMQNYA